MRKIFCPMAGKHFDRIKDGKSWEFRKFATWDKRLSGWGREDTFIELRRGYNGPSIIARITGIRVFIRRRIPEEVLTEGHVSKEEIAEIFPDKTLSIIGIHFEPIEVFG